MRSLTQKKSYANTTIMLKGVISMVVFLVITSSNLKAQFAGGSGTEADPYQISTPAQLDSVRYFHTSQYHFELINDINLDISPFNIGQGWNPISFSGTFDGKGYTISNLYIHRTGSTYVGLFSYLTGSSASIVSVNVVSANIDAKSGGVLVGQLSGGATVEKSSAVGNFNGTDEPIGGLVGRINDGTVSESYADVNIVGTIDPRLVGGLIGNIYFNGGDVYNSFSRGDINAPLASKSGGLIGDIWFNLPIVVENSYSTGHLILNGSPTSGLIGGNGGTNVMNDNFWDVETSGTSNGAGATNRTGVTGQTSSQMKTGSTFTNAGWDFNNVWAISSEINDGYPYLRNVNPNLSTSNNPPIASNVVVSGSLARDSLLTGSYSYTDVDSNHESGTTFKWYSASDTSSTKTVIAGANASTFTLTSDEVGKFVQFVVFPSDGETQGDSVSSIWRGPIEITNSAPIASNVVLSGSLARDSLLTGSYSYSDVDSDPESGTTFKWYSASDTSSTKTVIAGANASTFTLTSDEVGKFVQFVVFPSDGETQGDSVKSIWRGPIEITNSAPIASNVVVSGSLRRDSLLTGSYSYTDVNSDSESGTTFKWYSSSDTSSSKTLVDGATDTS